MWDDMRFLLGTPNAVSLLYVFIFCSLIGSFLNVVIYRLPLERSVVFPPSACYRCGTPLPWWLNLPILSYFMLRGRCYYCAARFSVRYALIELFVAIYGTWTYYHFGGAGWAWLHHFILFCVCLSVFFTDVDHWIIPDEVNLFGVIVGCALSSFLAPWGDVWALGVPSHWGNLVSSVLGVAVGYGFFWGISKVGLALAKQDAMGGGDVKFAAALGAFLGWKFALEAFFLSFFLGALFALLMYVFGRAKGKDPVPFGTFMAVAAVAMSLYGPQLEAKFQNVFLFGFGGSYY